eukprot:SAG11_NODE_3053_length_2722_cov_3.880853_1_plen_264_part_10
MPMHVDSHSNDLGVTYLYPDLAHIDEHMVVTDSDDDDGNEANIDIPLKFLMYAVDDDSDAAEPDGTRVSGSAAKLHGLVQQQRRDGEPHGDTRQASSLVEVCANDVDMSGIIPLDASSAYDDEDADDDHATTMEEVRSRQSEPVRLRPLATAATNDQRRSSAPSHIACRDHVAKIKVQPSPGTLKVRARAHEVEALHNRRADVVALRAELVRVYTDPATCCTWEMSKLCNERAPGKCPLLLSRGVCCLQSVGGFARCATIRREH